MVFSLTLGVILLAWLVRPALAESDAMKQGMSLYYQKQWMEAAPKFQEEIDANPQNSLALSFLLDCYRQTHDLPTEISNLEKNTESRGKDPVSQAQLGIGYFAMSLGIPSMEGESLEQLKQAMDNDERLALARTGLGMVYFQKRLMPRAKGYLIDAIRYNNADPVALELLGNIMLVDERNPEQALGLFRKVAELFPSYPEGHYYIGSALYDLKRYDDAIPELTRAVELDALGIDKGYYASILIGDVYMNQQKKDLAIKAYEKALAMYPQSGYVKFLIEQAKKGKPVAMPGGPPLATPTPTVTPSPAKP